MHILSQVSRGGGPRRSPGPVPPTAGASRRRRREALPTGALLLGVAASVLVPAGTASAAGPLPSPPDNIVVFPDRDMVVLEGYEDRAGQPVEIRVLRDGRLMGAAKGRIAAASVPHLPASAWRGCARRCRTRS